MQTPYLERHPVGGLKVFLCHLIAEESVTKIKQGFIEGYSQRLIEGNIDRLKLSRLRPHRLRLWWLRPMG